MNAVFDITPESVAELQRQMDHDDRLKREEEVEKFFSAKTIRTADAILWESGVELTLTPKD